MLWAVVVAPARPVGLGLSSADGALRGRGEEDATFPCRRCGFGH